MNHTTYLRDCLKAALIQQGHDVECLSDAIEFIGPDARVEIALGTASYCGSVNSYVAHLRIQSLNELEEESAFDYDHTLLWHASNYVGLRFRPYDDDSPALALRLMDVANLAQVIGDIVTKYGPLGLVDCVQYATGGEINLVDGTESGVTMILEGEARGVKFTSEQRAFMLGTKRADKPYSIRDLWATPLTMIDEHSPMAPYAEELSRSMLVEEFQSIYSNAPASKPPSFADEFDEEEDALDSMGRALDRMCGRTMFSARLLVDTLGPLVLDVDHLSPQQQEAATAFGVKLLSDLPLYVSAVLACVLGLGDKVSASLDSSTTSDKEALRVCARFFDLYHGQLSSDNAGLQEWLRIATPQNAIELASLYSVTTINDDSITRVQEVADQVIARHIKANEEMNNVLDEAFWRGSLHELVSGTRYKMALRELKLNDIMTGVSSFTATTAEGVDNTNWVYAKMAQSLCAIEGGVHNVAQLVDYAACWVNGHGNKWQKFSVELLRRLPLSVVAALAIRNACVQSKQPDNVVVKPILTYMEGTLQGYMEFMELLLSYDVPEISVTSEYVEELAAVLRQNNADCEGAARDLALSSAGECEIDLLMRPLSAYKRIVPKVKAHAIVTSHKVLLTILDMTPAAMTNRLGEVRALFSTTRSTAPHERIVDYVADRMLLEVQGLAKTMLPALRATIYDLPARSVYMLTTIVALGEFATFESELSGATARTRKPDTSIVALREFFHSVQDLMRDDSEQEQDENGEQDAHDAPARGRPFSAKLPKCEEATFMTAKASTCKQSRMLSAMNIARAVFAGLGGDASAYGISDCNSLCRAVSSKVDEVSVVGLIEAAANIAAQNCELEVDQLRAILRRVPLVVSCSVYVADLLQVPLANICNAFSDSSEGAIVGKAAVFIGYVVNADFSQVRHDDVGVIDDIADDVMDGRWPWSPDDFASAKEEGEEDSNVGAYLDDMDSSDMTLEDMIAFVTRHKLETDADKIVAMSEDDLRTMIDDYRDAQEVE